MVHLSRETVEILLNLSSYSASCRALDQECFVIVKNRDVKLDLFYMTLFENFEMKNISGDEDEEDE